MASVQFFGRTAVVDAVKSRGLETWALFQGKQFICAAEGTAALNEFLEKLEPGGSVAVYTLAVYKDADADEITNKTENNGSFNFRLTQPASSGGNRSTDERLDRIEGLLMGDQDDDEDDDGDDENSITGILMGYLKDPDKLATIIGAFRGNNSVAPALGLPGVNMPAAVGAVEQPASEDLAQRVALVLDRLERADPQILKHLEQLADLAEKKPQLFKLLLTQLDSGI